MINLIQSIYKSYKINSFSIFNEISALNKRNIFFKSHNIYIKKPNSYTLSFLNEKGIEYSVTNISNLKKTLENLLEEKTNNKTIIINDLLIVIDDNLKDIIEVIEKYKNSLKKIHLVSLTEPLNISSNLKPKLIHYDLKRFISKK
jgi:hypothetical protein